MPSTIKNLTSTEQSLFTASQELIIVSGTVTNLTSVDMLVTVALTRNGQKFFPVKDMILPGTNYLPITRKPENVCIKMILGAGDALSAFAIPLSSQDWWQNSQSVSEIDAHYQTTIYGTGDSLVVANFGYFPMED